MSRASKTELSKQSRYWIPRNRYHELRYFRLQFRDWERRRIELSGLATRQDREPTESEAIERAHLDDKIKMVTYAAHESAFELERWVLLGVTTGLPYDKINASDPMPCCRDTYYSMYRKFFWILDALRD